MYHVNAEHAKKTNCSPNKKPQLLLQILLLQLNSRSVDVESPFKAKSSVERKAFFTQAKITKAKDTRNSKTV